VRDVFRKNRCYRPD
jgi:hypothetical protein